MIRTVPIVAALMIGAIAPAWAAPEPKEEKPLVDPDKVVCRRIQALESRISTKRECHTRREWRALADQARDDRERVNAYRGRATGS